MSFVQTQTVLYMMMHIIYEEIVRKEQKKNEQVLHYYISIIYRYRL